MIASLCEKDTTNTHSSLRYMYISKPFQITTCARSLMCKYFKIKFPLVNKNMQREVCTEKYYDNSMNLKYEYEILLLLYLPTM